MGSLASHICGPGLIQAQCHMWVEFVVAYHLIPLILSSENFPYYVLLETIKSSQKIDLFLLVSRSLDLAYQSRFN